MIMRCGSKSWILKLAIMIVLVVWYIQWETVVSVGCSIPKLLEGQTTDGLYQLTELMIISIYAPWIRWQVLSVLLRKPFAVEWMRRYIVHLGEKWRKINQKAFVKPFCQLFFVRNNVFSPSAKENDIVNKEWIWDALSVNRCAFLKYGSIECTKGRYRPPF